MAVSTPLCLFEAGVDFARFSCAPLPGPAFSRNLTLIARRQELGRVPREVAAFCRRTLESEVLPGLASALPWLAPPLSVSA